MFELNLHKCFNYSFVHIQTSHYKNWINKKTFALKDGSISTSSEQKIISHLN